MDYLRALRFPPVNLGGIVRCFMWVLPASCGAKNLNNCCACNIPSPGASSTHTDQQTPV